MYSATCSPPRPCDTLRSNLPLAGSTIHFAAAPSALISSVSGALAVKTYFGLSMFFSTTRISVLASRALASRCDDGISCVPIGPAM